MILDLILDPFKHTFMQKALFGATLASINCAIIGAYVILRRMSFLGEALTHTLLPGIVFAYLKGFNLFFGALFASILTSLGIGVLSAHKEVRQDTAIGVMLSFMFALGILMMSYVRSFRDFSSILFGSILGITSADLILMSSISFIVLSTLFLLHKELELSSVDHLYSKFIRIRPNLLRNLLFLLIALSVVCAVQMIGALLTTALLITPAASAVLIARSLTGVMIFSTLIAIFSSFFGLLASFYFQVSSGASIVIITSLFFFVFWLIKSFSQDNNNSCI